MNRILEITRRALIIAVVVVAVAYAGDYLWLTTECSNRKPMIHLT